MHNKSVGRSWSPSLQYHGRPGRATASARSRTRRLLSLEQLEERQLLSVTADPVTHLQLVDFVTGLYQDLLHRTPAADELAGWVTALDSGATRTQVVQGFLSSGEYLTEVITSNYRTFLGRSPSDGELGTWRAALEAGLHEEGLQAGILASGEYYQNHGGNVTDWLTGLYGDLLGRAPDSAGLASWSETLRQGTMRQSVALDFVNSGEENSRVVTAAYQQLLDRAPEDAGFNGFVNALGDGLTWSGLRTIIASSPEYFGKPNSGPTVTDPTVTDPTATDPTITDPTVTDPTVSDPTAAAPTVADPTVTDPTVTDPTVADSTVADSTVSDATVTDPTVADPASATPSSSGPVITTPYDTIPDFGAKPTIFSAFSGAWSNPHTWSAGRLPRTGNVVVISPSTSVTYDLESSAHLKTVEVQAGGQLLFRTDINTHIVVGNFLVLQGGYLEIGTVAKPVAPKVMVGIEIADQAIDTTKDPSAYGTGLIVLGKVSIVGPTRTAFAQLAAEPKAGATTITVAVPVQGWVAGDELVLPDTRQVNPNSSTYVPQWEEVTVASVSASGTVITLTKPLLYDHLGAHNASGGLDFLPHVMSQASNIMIGSENPSGTRGHVMFTYRADVDIRYTGFCELGRTTLDAVDNTTFSSTGHVTHIGTNQNDRFAMNAHHLIGPTKPQPNGYQFTFIGDQIDDDEGPSQTHKWGITIHGSHYGLIQDNAVYEVGGAGIVTEDGSESFNTINHNMVARVHGRVQGPSDADGTAGEGFWLRGPNNRVTNNVATDISGAGNSYGYNLFLRWLKPKTIPAYQGADPSVAGQGITVNMHATPLLEFAGNQVYGATRNGIAVWHLGTIYRTPQGDAGTIKNFVAWNFFTWGYYGYETNNLVIDGFVARGGSTAATATAKGMWFADYLQRNLTITNADIQGMNVGIDVPYAATTTTIKNSYLRNNVDIDIRSMATVNSPSQLPPRTTIITNVKFDSMPGKALLAIRMNYQVQSAGASSNLIQLDQVFVNAFNGVAGDNFQVFYVQQQASFIVPKSSPAPNGLVGSPEAGLTNEQNWRRHGIAIAGAIAPPSAVSRDGISGLVMPM